MSNVTKNLVLILGLLIVGFAGYYIYTQQGSSALSFRSNDQVLQNMLSNTQVFIQRRQELEKVELNVSFFEDPRFVGLRSFSKPIQEQPIGRPDPFAEIGARATN